jgi:disulfide bond formation protein DsbB
MNCNTMNKICACLTTKHVHYFLILVAAASLIFAYIAEHGFGILPCDFCIYERCIYAGIIVVGLLSLKTETFSGHRGIFAQLLVLTIGIALTFYHVGMEQHWWAGPTSCTGPAPAATFEDYRAQLMKLRPRCDQVSWAIFGISATLWNLMLQAGLAFLTSLGLYLPSSQSQVSPNKKP